MRILFMIPLFVGLVVSGCSKKNESGQKTENGSVMSASSDKAQLKDANNAEVQKEQMAVCPVSNTKMRVSEAYAKIDYKGITYYFCCDRCKQEFQRDPGKYIKK